MVDHNAYQRQVRAIGKEDFIEECETAAEEMEREIRELEELLQERAEAEAKLRETKKRTQTLRKWKAAISPRKRKGSDENSGSKYGQTEADI